MGYMHSKSLFALFSSLHFPKATNKPDEICEASII